MKNFHLFIYLFLLLPLSMAWGQNDTITLEQICKRITPFTNDTVYHIDPVHKTILPNFTQDSIFTYYKKLFKLDKHTELRVHRWGNRNDSVVSYRYDQYYKNILVQHGGASVQAVNNFVNKVNMHLKPVEDDTIVLISKQEAIQIAVKATPAEKYTWEWYAKGETREEMLQDTTAEYYPSCTLMYANNLKHNSRLVYQVYISAHTPQIGDRVLIDPKTGEILSRFSTFQYCSACTYNGNEANLPINTFYNNAQNITLQDCSFATSAGNNNGKGYRLTEQNTNHHIDARYFHNDKNYESYTWTDDTPYDLMVSFQVQKPNFGANDGAITTSVVEDISNNFTYEWKETMSNISYSTKNLSNLPAGLYELTITDDLNCTYKKVIALGEQGANVPVITISNYSEENCYEYGQVELAITQVSSDYQTHWIGPNSSSLFGATTIENLPQGEYALLVEDFATAAKGEINFAITKTDNCLTQREIIQTAYWGVEQADLFFTNTMIHNLYLSQSTPTTTTPTQLWNTINMYAGDASLKTINITGGRNGNFDDMTNQFNFGENIVTNPNQQPWVSLDIIGHEYGHGMVKFELGLSASNSGGETGALIEGFCDIMGILLESKHTPIDWTVGNDFLDPAISGDLEDMRNIQDPKMTQNPNTYFSSTENPSSQSYWTNDLANIPLYIHRNSTVFSHWFYLLVNGTGRQTLTNDKSWQYNFTGIGLTNATQILYDLFDDDGTRLSMGEGFVEACTKTLEIALAKENNVPCGSFHLAVANAWYAVGLQKSGINCMGYNGGTCTDGIQNNLETDVDCGGPNCSPCDDTGCNDNEPPTIDDETAPPASNHTVCYNQEFCITAPIYDENLDDLVISINNSNFYEWDNSDPTDYFFCWTPTEQDLNQTHFAEVIITDECQNITTKEYNITVACGPPNCSVACPTTCAPSNITVSTIPQKFQCSLNYPPPTGGSISIASNNSFNGCNSVDLYVNGTLQNGLTATNLVAGNYNVELVADGNQVYQNNVTITEVWQGYLKCSAQVTQCESETVCNGSMTVSASGGSGNYTYVWNTGCSGNTCSNLSPGVCSVTIEDPQTGCYCSISRTITYHQPPQPCPDITIAVTPNIFINGTIIDFGAYWGAVDGGTIGTTPSLPKEPIPIIITAQHVSGKRFTIHQGELPINTPQKLRLNTKDWPSGLYVFTIQQRKKYCWKNRTSAKAIKIGRGG